MVAKFPNPNQVVMEIGHDVPARDRGAREKHIKISIRNRWGNTRSSDNNLQSGGVDIGAGGTRCHIKVTRSEVDNESGRLW